MPNPPSADPADPPATFAATSDVRASRGRPRVAAESLRGLQTLEPWRALGCIAFDWTSLLLVAALCDRFWHPLAYVAAVIWIGSRQHALGVMAHDGAHHLIVRQRSWNDWLTRLLLAWPVFMAFDAYRPIHRLHHRHLNTERDPDWARNRPDRLATRRGPAELAKILLGLTAEQKQVGQFFGAKRAEGQRLVNGLRLAYYALVFAGFAAAGRLDAIALYWLVPLFSWFLVTMRLKGTAEHFAVTDEDSTRASRTVVANGFERVLVAPRNVSYHVEHHLYPGVPFYNLPALHAVLMEDAAYRAHAHVTRGYASYLRECVAFGRPSGAW